ncbi:MAG: ribonuclease P Rpr2/Rpp21/SNM1 subunit [Acidilobaceae archaeon]
MKKSQQQSKRKKIYIDIVRQRYNIIFNLALAEARKGNYERARMLCNYMKAMATRTRVRIPRELKRSICKNCNLPLIPGVTATIRFRSQSRRFSYRVIKCKACSYIHRYLYSSIPLKKFQH